MVLRDFISRAERDGHRLQHHRGASISPGRSSKAASAPTGACSTPRASRNSPGPARSPIPITGRWRLLAVLLGVLFSLPLLAMSATLTQAAGACIASACRRRLVRRRLRVLEGTLFCARRGLRARPRRRAAVPLVLIAMARIEEIAAIAFGRKPTSPAAGRLAAARTRGAVAPKVSIHIPAYREPPEMLKATLDAVARLTYPNFECIVDHQQHARPGFLAAGRGALHDARRALQVPARRQGRGLQGRRASHRA